ncbi:MAG: serine hydrolase domain-containing protein [Nocardioides sp.]
MTEPIDRQPSALQTNEELAGILAELAAEHSLAGISAGVVVDGSAQVATYGVTDTKAPREVDADTLFMIGSTSKTVTATTVMALVDRGDLSLTDRVIDHLPDFRLLDMGVASSVTVGQLLNHTGGWRGDLNVDSGWGDDALDLALAEVATSPQELAPGTLASYSNSGFIVAGKVAAVAAGVPFEKAVRDLVLTPLGLTNSWYYPWEVAHRQHAVGHIVVDDKATSVPIFPAQRWLGPAGGLWSCLRDQLTYLRYHLDGTVTASTDGAAPTPPLTEESRLLMQQETIAARSGISGVGLSWLFKQQGDVRLVTHGGNVSNVHTSSFDLAPDHGLGVTVLTNGKHGAAVGAKVLEWALDRYRGIGPPPSMAPVPFTADDLVGTYDLGPFKVVMTVEDESKLFVNVKVPDDVSDEVRIAFTNPPRELVAVGTDVFALAASPTSTVLDVRRAPDGAVTGIVHGLRFAPRLP